MDKKKGNQRNQKDTQKRYQKAEQYKFPVPGGSKILYRQILKQKDRQCYFKYKLIL